MNSTLALHSHRVKIGRAGIILVVILVAAVCYVVTASRRVEQNLRQEALPELQYDAQKDPRNPRVLYALGVEAQRAGQRQLALDSLGQAALLTPDDEQNWLTWARTAAATQGSHAAIEILNTFLQIHPHSARTHLMLGQIYSELGDHQLAYTEAKTAAQQNSRSDQAWRLAGNEALKNQDYSVAEEDFRHAVTLVPGDWANQHGLGDALFFDARYPEAVKCYREAVRLAPSMGVTHLTLGETLLHTANSAPDFEAARASLQQALALKQSLTTDGLFLAYLTLGQSYAAEGRWQEALPWLQQAVPYEPANANVAGEVHFELARAYRGLHDPAHAAQETELHTRRMLYDVQIRSLSSRILSHPEDALAYLRLARLYADHGDDTDADALYQQALTKSPDLKAAQQEYTALLRRHTAAPTQDRNQNRNQDKR